MHDPDMVGLVCSLHDTETCKSCIIIDLVYDSSAIPGRVVDG